MDIKSRKMLRSDRIAVLLLLLLVPTLARPGHGYEFKSEEERSLSGMQSFIKEVSTDKEAVWPGYELKNIALVMQGDKNDFFFNGVSCSSTSYLNQSVCAYQAVDMNGLPVYVKPDKYLEAPAGCIRPVIDNKKIKTWIAYIPPYDVMAGLYKTVGKELAFDDYLLSWVHEAFHVYQILNWNPMTKIFVDQNGYIKGLDDERVYGSMAKEGKALYNAATAKKRSDILRNLRTFFKWRDERRKFMKDEVAEMEKKFELSEGTAQYVQYKTGLDLLKNPPDIKGEPRYGGFKSAEEMYQEKLKLVKSLNFKNTKMKGNWCYNWGMAQAIILDALYPDWKREMNKKAFFMEDKLREAIK